MSGKSGCTMWTDGSGAIQIRATITLDAYRQMNERQLHDFEQATILLLRACDPRAPVPYTSPYAYPSSPHVSSPASEREPGTTEPHARATGRDG